MNFISDYSLFWIIPIIFLSIILTMLVYQNKGWVKELSNVKKFVLRFLRFSSIFLILFLLLGIIIQGTKYKEEKPIFVTLIDNSSSMMNYRDSLLVKKQISEFRNKLSSKFGERFELVELNVGSKVSSDKLNFKDKISALELGFEKINIVH